MLVKVDSNTLLTFSSLRSWTSSRTSSHLTLAALGVDGRELSLRPGLVRLEPGRGSLPEVVVGLEGLLDLGEELVVRDFLLEESLAGVEELRLFVGLLELLGDSRGVPGDVLDLRELVVVAERLDLLLEDDEAATGVGEGGS